MQNLSKENRDFCELFIGAKTCEKIVQAMFNNGREARVDEIPFHEHLVEAFLLKTQKYCENL